MRRKKVLLISAVALSFAVTGGFALKNYVRAAEYKQLLENSYTHAYSELVTAVSELDTALQKCCYTSSPYLLNTLCAEIYGKSVAAQMALGELPLSDTILEQTCAFLARTGDYAFSLAHSSVADPNLCSRAHETLRGLVLTSSTLSSALLDLYEDISAGTVSIRKLVLLEGELAQHTADGEAAPGGTAFQSIEADFPETPALIYDGPFSEHLSSRTPLALAGLPECSRDEARAAAAQFLNLRPDVLSPAGQSEGALPTWSFSAAVDGGEVYVEVTRQGCKVISLFTSRAVGESTCSIQDARSVAARVLSQHGYPSLKESYYINQGNVLTVNYAPVMDGVYCYPDLVKVSVALDTGSVVGFEAHGWIMNHTGRVFSPATVSRDEAEKLLSPELTVLSHQMALIPTGGEYEVLCHEFKCSTDDDDHIIVYINAQTGNEEKILLLLENENGTLVW